MLPQSPLPTLSDIKDMEGLQLFQRPPDRVLDARGSQGREDHGAVCCFCSIRIAAMALPCGHAGCQTCIQGMLACPKCSCPVPDHRELRVMEQVTASAPLAYLHSAVTVDEEESIQPDERILLPVQCDIVSPFLTVPGELLIGNKNIYFKENPVPGAIRDGVKQHLRSVIAFGSIDRDPGRLPHWPNRLVVEAHPRRYLLQHTALEVFLSNGSTVLFACKTQRGRDEALSLLRGNGSAHFPLLRKVRNVGSHSIDGITSSWVQGAMTNFEYLMHLNK